MSSNQESANKVEVGSDDITITERGDVQIVNVRLAETLKTAIAADRERGAGARAAATNYVCPGTLNAYCPKRVE